MKIYTRQGDTGDTGLFDGRRVRKDNLRIETYGTVDELNSFLGVAITTCRHESLAGLLRQLQLQLFDLGADLATPTDSANAAKIHRISPEHVAGLEAQIDAATAQVPPLKHFVLPGGGPTAAHLHVARTVCRRAERLAVTLAATEDIGPQAVVYLNRLSDLLFTLARLANHLDGISDVEWIPSE
ncbi:MAG: cob(I)yrinic acid a,c-diamide adenosyltransferase [Phycisphaerae bacterium]